MREPEMLRRMGQNSARRIREAFTLSLFERRLRELLERVPVSTPCGVCTDSPVPALGAARLSMQWASYRLANGLRCRLDIQKHVPFFKIPGAMREGGVLLAHIRGEGALAKDQEALNE